MKIALDISLENFCTYLVDHDMERAVTYTHKNQNLTRNFSILAQKHGTFSHNHSGQVNQLKFFPPLTKKF